MTYLLNNHIKVLPALCKCQPIEYGAISPVHGSVLLIELFCGNSGHRRIRGGLKLKLFPWKPNQQLPISMETILDEPLTNDDSFCNMLSLRNGRQYLLSGLLK